MMARAHPALALRPLLPADVPLLADIFRASVAELTADDYSPAQQEAWVSAADDEEAFAERLGKRADADRHARRFAGRLRLARRRRQDRHALRASGRRGQGVGAMLCDALEKLAAARGAKQLTVDASDTARDFFARRGFAAQRRNTVPRGGEWLANTTMEKTLAGKRGTP